MAIFSGASRGAVVRMRCPHCGKVQARARGAKDYECKACGKSFTAAQGNAEQEELTPSSARRRPSKR